MISCGIPCIAAAILLNKRCCCPSSNRARASHRKRRVRRPRPQPDSAAVRHLTARRHSHRRTVCGGQKRLPMLQVRIDTVTVASRRPSAFDTHLRVLLFRHQRDHLLFCFERIGQTHVSIKKIFLELLHHCSRRHLPIHQSHPLPNPIGRQFFSARMTTLGQLVNAV